MNMLRPEFDNWKKAENYYRIAIQQITEDIAKIEDKLVFLKRKRGEYKENLQYIIKQQNKN